MMLAISFIDIFNQIYQPEEVEEVKVVSKSVENSTKEYESAVNRLAKAKLVGIIILEL